MQKKRQLLNLEEIIRFRGLSGANYLNRDRNQEFVLRIGREGEEESQRSAGKEAKTRVRATERSSVRLVFSMPGT